MADKSRILFIDGINLIGRYIVESSVKAGHPTLVFLEESRPINQTESMRIENFRRLGVQFIEGDLSDFTDLVNAIKQADVVISTIRQWRLEDQIMIIYAIKEAGNVKRFFPSEFGEDVDRVVGVLEPLKTSYIQMAGIRRLIEDAEIPYTYVCGNLWHCYFTWTIKMLLAPATQYKVNIIGDGNHKGVFNCAIDIGDYTIKAVDDPRTLNKILYIKPPMNIYSLQDLISLLESKTGIIFERNNLTEEGLLEIIEETTRTDATILSLYHSAFVKGSQTGFEIDPAIGVEASELYPDVEYTNLDKLLMLFLTSQARNNRNSSVPNEQQEVEPRNDES